MLDEKKWVEINKFPESVGSIHGIFEVKNVFYVAGIKGISTFNNEFYKFPSDIVPVHKYFNRCRSCRVENNILVVRQIYRSDVVSKLFNPISKQWSDVKIKTTRNLFDVVHYLNKVWIVGGRQLENDGNYKERSTIQIYDPVNKTTSLSQIEMIQARSSHRVVVYKNKLFVFGGYASRNGTLNSVEMYSPDTNKFTMMAPMKIPRYGFACCGVGNIVYVIGGWTVSGKTKSVEIYNLDTNIWFVGPNFPFNLQEMELHGCAVNTIFK